MKIGLFGGSFDPIHNGHLKLAAWTKDQLSLDRMIFIPAAIPPHKQHLILTSSKHRCRMVRLAIENFPDFEMSDIEIRRRGISYTIDTIFYFKKRFNLDKENLYLLIGADSLLDLPGWKEPNKILTNCHVVVLPRQEFDLSSISADMKQQVQILPAPLFDVSSTTIRQKIKNGESVAHLLPVSVMEYIHEQRLYRD